MQNINLSDQQLQLLKKKYKLRGLDGTEGQIYLYNDNGQKVAMKLFNTTCPKVLENKEKKIKLLYKKPLDSNILKPIKTVSNNDRIIGYTQQLVLPHSTFDDIKVSANKKNKLEYLKKAKYLIENLHDNDIIHGDIRSFNLLVQHNVVKLCDIDNCIIEDLNYDVQGSFADIYKNGVGTIDKYIDVFSHNIVTVAVLRKLLDHVVYDYIKKAVSINSDIATIYNEMLNLSENYSGEYLIDKIDKKMKIKFL